MLINKWKLKNQKHTKYSLIIQPDCHLELKNNLEPKFKNIYINLNYKKVQFYRNNKNLKIAKAIGIKKNKKLIVLDATAGLGKDSFIFFSLGCKVFMIERNPVLAALLNDGLERGYKDKKIGNLLKKNIKLIHTSKITTLLLEKIKPDVVYLDPMFPKIKKTSLSKKNIRIIRDLVGNDNDSDILFQKFQSLMIKKIVVKRPRYANHLGNKIPKHIIKTKKHRFDIYKN
ncbi:class I SAM-dependent methyltransferase [Buchnera aphidicola]|uniref:class I SAM-dependent methyltransferase n=1 Tax=Buchnera aphidicola TaxID=9 RepID=UPI0034644D3C